MPESPDRIKRRHVREKAVIDHLVDKVFEPAASIDEQVDHSPTISTGQSVEEQVRKEWNPDKGGLPIFSRKQE
jgi:hypothetical protein